MYVRELGYDVKSTELSIKDIDGKQGIVVGYFSAFDVKDADNEVVVKGAFKKSIEERGPKSSKPRIKHLLDHNKKNAVATLLELEEDNVGLRYESKAGRHTAGQDWLKMCEDGIITEHSTGAAYPKDKIQNKGGVSYLTEAVLFEGSSLQFLGANGNTPIVSIKEMELDKLSGRFTLLEKAIRNGKYSDAAFKELIIELEAIKSLLNKLIVDETTQPEHSKATTEPEPARDIINQLFTFNN